MIKLLLKHIRKRLENKDRIWFSLIIPQTFVIKDIKPIPKGIREQLEEP